MMFKILTLLFFLSSFAVKAQNLDVNLLNLEKAKNEKERSVFLELGGVSRVISFNFETDFWRKEKLAIAGRSGYGIFFHGKNIPYL